MDDELIKTLNQQDWIVIGKRLTLFAEGKLALCGWLSQGNCRSPSGKAAEDYVLEAIGRVYASATTGTYRWEDSRGDQTRCTQDRLLSFLKQIVIQQITDEVRTAKSAAAWPSLSLDSPDHVPEEMESAAEAVNIELVMGADDDLASFNSGCVEQLRENPGSTRVNWQTLREALGLSRHRCDQLRIELKQHLANHQSKVAR